MKLTAKQARAAGIEPGPQMKPKGESRAKRSLPKPLEKEVQAQIVQWLTLQGVLWIRINSGSMTGAANGGQKRWHVRFCSTGRDEESISDLLCCWRGRFVAIEVKRPGKKTSDKQQEFLIRVQNNGGIGIVAWCLEDVQSALEYRS